MVTHRFPLSEVSRAYDVAEKREGIKVVIDC
jgi:threonine dehydrogenase-like Zn-dependent dehydrogenase